MRNSFQRNLQRPSRIEPPRFARKFGLVCITGLIVSMLTQPVIAYRMVEDVTAQLEIPAVQVREGEDAVFKLILSRPLDFKIRFAYRTEDLTAKAGKDYVAEQGLFVIPAGTRYMELPVKTLTDQVIDKNKFKLVLSDMETHGYGTVWGSYVWTDRWRIEGIPETITATARIKNVLNEARRRQEPGHNKY